VSASTGRMFRRSRLLYWKTTGTWSKPRPSSARFDAEVAQRLKVGVERYAWLSATKTIPSTPFSTSFRVAL